jgi:hypothetical protein
MFKYVTKRRFLLMTLFTLLLSFVATPSASASSTGQLMSYWNRKCLDADLNSVSGPYIRVQMWDCNGWDNQRWYIAGNGIIRNVHFNNTCLDIKTEPPYNGDSAVVHPCFGNSTQNWYYYKGGFSNEGPPALTYCLDADMNQNWNGGNVQVWACNGWSNQVWSLPA